MPDIRWEVRNVTRGTVLASEAELATSLWGRFKGLMFRNGLPEGGGLVIRPCGSIHMFFMRFAIDVIHAGKAEDGGDPIVRVIHSIKPWRAGPIVWKSKYVIELPAGTLERTGTQAGDLVDVKRTSPSSPTQGAPGRG